MIVSSLKAFKSLSFDADSISKHKWHRANEYTVCHHLCIDHATVHNIKKPILVAVIDFSSLVNGDWWITDKLLPTHWSMHSDIWLRIRPITACNMWQLSEDSPHANINLVLDGWKRMVTIWVRVNYPLFMPSLNFALFEFCSCHNYYQVDK